MANATLTFLPWTRQGAAAAITTPVDSLGTSKQAAVAALAPALTLNGTPVPATSVALRGPADVLGIDANQVVRTDPRPNTTDFEPNCFPSIEFDRPDFPWLFTPTAPASGGKLRPWLCLVVVRNQPGVTLNGSPDAPTPTLQIAAPADPAVELPDLAESWAWAHAQVAADDGSTTQLLENALNGAPELSLSRLICPRALAADTDYIACVVPTFEVGRRAGLGLPVLDADLAATKIGLAPAWTIPATGPMPDVLLPVYHHWEFRTGPLGDFESLALDLKTNVPAALGKRVTDISQPGFATGLEPGTTLGMEGALQPLIPGGSAIPAPWSDGPAASFRQNLAPVISEPGTAQAGTPPVPLLAPPMYGRWHAGKTTADPTVATWFEELNLDPRWRAAAALGTRVVQDHQEALMASAWEQAAELPQANQRMRQLQLSMAVGEVLYKKHFSVLSEEQLLRVAAPAFGRIRQDSGASLLQTQSHSQLPVAATRTAMRRVGRQRGPLTRRIARQGGERSPTQTWVQLLFSMSGFPAAPPVPVPDRCELNTLLPFTAMPTDSHFGAYPVYPEGVAVPSLGIPVVQPAATDVPGFLRKAVDDHIPRFFATHPVPPRPLFIIFQDIKSTLVSRLHPHAALPALVKATITTGSSVLAPTPSPAIAPIGVETVMAAPSFPQPMYEALRDLSQDLLLPGLDSVPPNTVLGLKTNRRFVEAYMVGLNHEMGRELLWRGYPTDQRGTYFTHFWGLGEPNAKAADIEDLDTWNTRRLGDPSGAPVGEEFVMLIRSSLLRRYPNAVIYLAPVLQTTSPSGQVTLGPDPDPSREIMPLFSGALRPDIGFFGFPVTSEAAVGNGPTTGYYVVIQEHPTEPRFGIDTTVQPSGASHLAVGTTPPPGLVVPSVYTWGGNSAHMAGITRRLPVRVAIHASRLITPV